MPVSGVNFLEFAQKWPEIEDSSQSCLQQSVIPEETASVPQRF